MKYPRIPHVYAEFSGLSKDDLRYSRKESESILENKYVILTEKLDGSNVGIEFSPGLSINFRGNPVYGEEFDILKAWCSSRIDKLRSVLNNRYILFGEWLYYIHTLKYNRLPHYLIAFDVFDKNQRRFISYDTVVKIAKEVGLPHAPILYNGLYKGFNFLKSFLDEKSKFGDEKIEGIVGRIEENGLTVFMFKFVNPDFRERVDQSKHWKKEIREKQGLDGNIKELFE